MTHSFRVARLAALAALMAGPALAEGFDTSGIAADPALVARVPAKMKAAGVLVGAADNAYAPWEYLAGADGQTPEGIDIDVGRAIAAKLGLTYESRTAEFDSILPALGTKYDVGIAALTISKERMEVVNFISYFRSTSLWAVKAGNPAKFDPASLCGTKLATQTGTWEEQQLHKESDACVAAGKPAIDTLPFGTQAEALTRVAAGGADATVGGDSTIALAAKNSEGQLETLPVPAGPAASDLGESGLNGIAVTKSDLALTQLIADALNELITDGTYAKLMAEWGLTVSVGKAEINPAVAE